MSTQTTLELPAKAAGASSQWRLQTLQLINWGGFNTYTEIPFSGGFTLLSGASGTGKSTVLDAFIALLMPSNEPFNGASNEGSGRARGREQRNLLTYLQGAIATKENPATGESELVSLRGGTGRPLWGAIGATYVNSDGTMHTLMRAYYGKAGATTAGDVVVTFASFEGYFDIRRLQPFAAGRFNKRAMDMGLPGLQIHPRWNEFEATFHSRLGIGGGDGGKRAMRLLARLQSGLQVSRVDTLYKTMVLEKPATYAAADVALEHFADIEAGYLKMQDEAEREKALADLPDLQQELNQHESLADLTAPLLSVDGPGPLGLWQLRTERSLLDTAVDTNRADHRTRVSQADAAKAEDEHLQARLTEIAEEKRQNGGDLIEQHRADLRRLSGAHDHAYQKALDFERHTRTIDLPLPETIEEFDQAQLRAQEFLENSEKRSAELEQERDGIREEELLPLKARQQESLAEIDSLKHRNGAVPRGLHEARVQMARAADLDPMRDLPFVAELIDVDSAEEHWRRAIEITLGGLARTVLVNRDVRDHLSRSIDGIRFSPRINFQAVTLADHAERRGRTDHVSGKLLFKDSPFSRFVETRVTGPDFDHLCVPGPQQLDGSGPRVTQNGQTRHGDRSAHGEFNREDIIGFTNERRLERILADLREIEPKLEEVTSRVRRIDGRIRSLREQKFEHTTVTTTRFEEIDTRGLETRIQDLEAEIERLLANSTTLEELDREERRLQPLQREANKILVLTEESLAQLAAAHLRLLDRQDEVGDLIGTFENTHRITVAEEQLEHMNMLLARIAPDLAHAEFKRAAESVKQQLIAEEVAAKRGIGIAHRAMERMFENFKGRWDEPDLGTTPTSAEGFREILDRIRVEGLPTRRKKWRERFTEYSSDDLLGLSDAFESAHAEITGRLEPVNAILETLPFGGRGHLKINSRLVQSEDVRRFRKSLRELASGIAQENTEGEIERRFRRLREFLLRIAEPEGRTSASQRARLLDVRQHVTITADCLDENGKVIATYNSLGGKSGGETQELVAFIVGSALRYQLGDEDKSQPRFAPVILDEGFVKADGEFSGRAVRAWQKFGFQLVIGAPEGKTGDFEPHMDLLLSIVKDDAGQSFVIPVNPVDPAESDLNEAEGEGAA